MIKNRELALIPDSALELVDPPGTSPVPRPRASARRASGPSHTSGHRRPRPPERPAR
jgi:hypothetical protein